MPFVVKLKFNGPNTVSNTTREEPMKIGHAIAFETEILADTCTLNDQKRFFEMERTFNELTKGRLHVEVFER